MKTNSIGPSTQTTNPITHQSINPLSDAQAFERLARLSPADYDRARKPEARRLRIRVETLDTQVAEYRAEACFIPHSALVSTEPGEGGLRTPHLKHSALSTLPSPEPWPEPVDGPETLSQTSGRFSLYVVLPPGAADAFALWSAHAHVFAAFPQTPRLNLSSPEPGCGKTTALDVIASLAPRPLRTENLTAPVLFRLVDQYQPTLLLDEVDSWLHQAEELRGLLNAGHKRGACAYRCEGDNKAVRAFKAFAPAVLAGLGPLSGTLADRSIQIPLLPARPEELAARFDSSRAEIETILCRKLARWTQDNFAALQACDPVLPATAFNRLADNWRPLFGIAQIAGGDWPRRALAAFTSLTVTQVRTLSTLPRRSLAKAGESLIKTRNQQPSLTPGNTRNLQPATFNQQLTLLSDIRQIFTQSSATRLSSRQLVDSLRALPSRTWHSAFCTPHSAFNRLARRLSSVGIKPCTMRIGQRLVKGYDVTDFTEVFARLVLDEPPDANGGVPFHQANE